MFFLPVLFGSLVRGRTVERSIHTSTILFSPSAVLAEPFDWSKLEKYTERGKGFCLPPKPCTCRFGKLRETKARETYVCRGKNGATGVSEWLRRRCRRGEKIKRKKRRSRLSGSEECLVAGGGNSSLEVGTSALPQRKRETRQRYKLKGITLQIEIGRPGVGSWWLRRCWNSFCCCWCSYCGCLSEKGGNTTHVEVRLVGVGAVGYHVCWIEFADFAVWVSEQKASHRNQNEQNENGCKTQTKQKNINSFLNTKIMALPAWLKPRWTNKSDTSVRFQTPKKNIKEKSSRPCG